MLKAIDDNWVEQVDYLQQLSLAIGSQSASQKNPIVEYYQEAYAGFETMKQQIHYRYGTQSSHGDCGSNAQR